MKGSLVVLTGASGSGKTAIARAVQVAHPEYSIFQFDTIGVPSEEVMARFGGGHQPGGAWQRAMTLQWFRRIASVVDSGEAVLFEGQMRIAFIREAVEFHKLPSVRVVLVECDDKTRASRLIHNRLQPELASDSMAGWAQYLHRESLEDGCEILDTSNLRLAESVARIIACFPSLQCLE